MSKLVYRVAVGLLVVGAVLQFTGARHLRASTSGVVISQVYGGGGNSGATYKNDFIELFNAGSTPVDITGWSVQYASSTGSSWNKTILSGSLAPGQYYLVQEAVGSGGTVNLPTPDATGSIAMSATAGKVALVSSTTTLTGTCPTAVVDFVGFGAANCSETSPTLALSNTTAALRKGNGAVDTDNNAADFSIGAPNPRNSGAPVQTSPSVSAPAKSVVPGDTVLLTATVTPGSNPASTGIQVSADLSAFGLSATQPFLDGGTGGDVIPNDLTFSFSLTVPEGTTVGVVSVPITVKDGQSRTGSATLSLTVASLVPIHDIQGPGTISPLVGKPVTTRGIVTGVKYNGFFIQAPDAEADADPDTSEGVFVYTGSTPGAAAVVGNLVQVSATVSEYKGTTTDPDGLSMTELSGPTTTVKSTGNALPTAANLSASDLNPGGSIFSLEKYEGMRVHLDAVTSISPTDGTVSDANATSTSSGVFFAVLPGVARPFREAGIETPLPVPSEAPAGATPPVFDANPERIGIDTFSVFLDPTTAAAYPPPAGTTLEVTTGVTVENITGPLDYAFRSYMVDTEGWNMPRATTGNMAATAVRARTGDEFTVATMNLARFFDTTNDAGVSDVALTPAAFAMRLQKASMAIRDVMRTPDIIGVEEIENLATLQALADKVSIDAGVTYDPYLKEGHDVGGIDVGFLVRHDKVAVDRVEQVGYETRFTDGTYLNDRPSLVLHVGIQNAPYEPYPVTVVVNHLRSLSGVEDSDPRVRAKRLAQAVELAAYLQGLQAKGEHIISVGDYNAFDVNDGYVDVMGLLKGSEAEASQVTLWAPSPVTPALFDLIGLADAGQRYSFVYSGNAQELDHILASADVHPTAIAYARMNADFPESYRGDATRPERLSDHDPIVGYFSLPDIDTTAPILTVPSSFTVEGNAFGGALVSFTTSAFDAVDGTVVPVCAPASGSLFRLGETAVNCTAVDAHGNVATDSFTVTVADTTPPVIAAAAPSATSLWAPNHSMSPVTVRVSVSDAVDPAPACRITGVSGDDGANASDWLITGPLTLDLRAERLGKGSGRTYTIGVVCVDGSGNVSQPGSTTVFVPHDQRR